jgi:hypothetical protein
LKSELEKEGSSIQFEFITPNNPQQKRKVEKLFATFWDCIRSILNDSGIKLWADCGLTDTKLCTYTSRRNI